MKKITFLAIGLTLSLGAFAQTTTWLPSLVKAKNTPPAEQVDIYVDQSSQQPIGTLLAGHGGTYAKAKFGQKVTVTGAVLYLKFINAGIDSTFNISTLVNANSKITAKCGANESTLSIDAKALATQYANSGLTAATFTLPTSLTDIDSVELTFESPTPETFDTSWTPQQLIAKVPFFAIGLAKEDGASPDFISGFITKNGISTYNCDVFFFPTITGGAHLSEVEKERLVQVFPNPAKDVITVLSSFEITNYEIFNMLGQRVVSENSNGVNASTINVSNLAAGNYIVKLHTNAGSIIKKVIVE